MNEELNPFKIAQAQFDSAAQILELDDSIKKLLREPAKVHKKTLKVKMDDGSEKKFKAFIVHYNDSRGPFKGGIRYHPKETVDTIKALAILMTLKSSIVNAPFGGGKSGVICDVKKMSHKEIERLTRSFVREFYDFIGPEIYIPAPDVYTNKQIMAWVLDEYEKIAGKHIPSVVTGKPIELGGSEGREDATAQGVIYNIIYAAEKAGVKIKNSKVVVQGYGNVGYYIASKIHKLGASVIGVSDSKGGIFNKKGLDVEKVFEFKKDNKTVVGFPGSKEISNKDLLELDCDILVPAALENQITEKNANNIKAKIVAEAANCPTTNEANDILCNKDIFIIPDFLCNSGGVVVSYFEWVQSMYGYYWPKDEIFDKLNKIMAKAFNEVYDMHENKKVDMRTAAYLVAVKRVADTMKLRGY